MERLLEIHTELAAAYGDKWQADCGFVRGRKGCTVSAGMDAQVALYLAVMHNALTEHKAAVDAKQEVENGG